MTIGSTLTTVFHVEGRPSAAFCTVSSEAPLYLTTRDREVGNLEFPRPIMLLWQQGDHVLKGEAEAVSVQSDASGWVVEVQKVQWEDLNRRRHPRVPVTVPVALRAVQELQGNTSINIFQGITEDLSLGGAWVRVEPQVEVGSLVEFQAHLGPNETVRTFGVVAHRSDHKAGVGIEFLDYVGAAHYMLHTFLAKAA